MRTKISLRSKVTAFPIVLVVLAGLVVFSCARPAPPTPALISPVVEELAKPAWQQQWDKVVAEGQKEGDLVIATPASSTARLEITKAFKQKTGITTEWIAGRLAEIATKLERERLAGIYSADVYYGSPPSIRIFKPQGMLAPLPPLLLPEVTDPQVWYGGEFPFVDKKEKYIFSSALYPTQVLLINTNLVSPGEINSYQDLLKPKWKGRIAMNDPSLGVGTSWFHSVIYNKVLTLDFMRELVKQEPIITQDFRLATEWIARSKYPILVAPQATVTAEFIEKGAPINYVMPKEGTDLTGPMGAIMKFDRAPHPKAAQVFVNWFLTKEAQKLISRLNLIQTARLDIDVDIPPFMKRQPGVKYYVSEDEEYLTISWFKNEKLAKEIFGPLSR